MEGFIREVLDFAHKQWSTGNHPWLQFRMEVHTSHLYDLMCVNASDLRTSAIKHAPIGASNRKYSITGMRDGEDTDAGRMI